MSDFPFDIVGFDLDGTLVDSSGDIAAAVNHVLAEAGYPRLSLDQVRRNIGGGSKQMLALSLGDAGGDPEIDLPRLHERLLAYYADHLADETRPFPGAIAALDRLAAQGVRLAVVTNKIERLAVKLLGALGVADRFACVIGGDTLGAGQGKPSAAPILEMIRRCGGGRAAFVGDSVYDVAAARNAGVPSVAVDFGMVAPAVDLGADAVIDSYDALAAALVRLGARQG